MEVTVAGETLVLLHQKAIYWPRRKALFIADAHLGKTTHFNKAGIWVPPKMIDADYFKLNQLFVDWDIDEVYFLGDLFHSTYNAEWERFGQWIALHQAKFTLILGNHDILNRNHYSRIGLHTHPEGLTLGPFYLVHDCDKTPAPEDLYALGGHIHPGYWLKGQAKQSVKSPCFYFGQRYGILPAFGTFTGLAAVKTQHINDKIYLLANTEIFEVLT